MDRGAKINAYMKWKPQYFIQLACSITLLGYAFMHFLFRGFNLWKIYPSSFVKLVCRAFDIPVQAIFYKGHPTNAYLAFLIISGSILLLSGIFTLFQHKLPKKFIPLAKVLLALSGLLILLHAFSAFVDSKLHYNVPLEFITRASLPFICIYLLSNAYHSNKNKLVTLWLPLIIGLTFFAHGLYALRFFPIPQSFLMMTTNILKTPRNITFNFLYLVGILDVLLLIGIFIKPVRKAFLYYAIIWGFLTALARLVAYYNPADMSTYILLWFPQFLIRAGHYLLPLALLFYWQQQKKELV
ncbi:MAG: hypothetical protein R2753_15540 [Chitinophagales bacterium]